GPGQALTAAPPGEAAQPAAGRQLVEEVLDQGGLAQAGLAGHAQHQTAARESAASNPVRRAARSCSRPTVGRLPGRGGGLPGRRRRGSSSPATTSAAVGRRRGSFASIPWINPSRGAEISQFRRAAGTGSWATMACSTSYSESAGNGCFPVASSYST